MDGVTFHLFDVLVSAGIIQAIIMVVLFSTRPVKSQQQTVFTWILLTLAVLSFKILLHTLGLWEMALFRYFPLAINTLLPPLLYCYVLSITGIVLKKKKVFLYLLPTFIFMVYAIGVYLMALGQSLPVFKDRMANLLLFNPIKTIEDIVAVGMAIIYWLFGFQQISRYRNWLFSSQSNTSLQEYKWLKNLLIISGLLVLALGVIVLLEDILKAGRHDFAVLQLFYIYLAAITYYLSFKGYSLYGTASHTTLVNEKIELTIRSPTNEITGEWLVIKGKIVESLETDQLYLNPELNLKDMARHIGYPASAVSAAINACFRQNFRGLVNQYRIGEVKKRLENPPSHLSLLGIAMDSGFNSEASFYRIFRQETGMSPNEYLQILK